MSANRWLGIGLLALGAGLAANSLLGPLITDAVRYHVTVSTPSRSQSSSP